VRVRAASVNALDWHTVHGGRLVRGIAFLLRQPTIPVRGVDVAGQVQAVGKDVTRLRPGDEVFGMARGSFAEYTTAREDRLVPKPPAVVRAGGRYGRRGHNRPAGFA
jgi:NADPH:quinone reductase-like Zn-dependent oxidoreductase